MLNAQKRDYIFLGEAISNSCVNWSHTKLQIAFFLSLSAMAVTWNLLLKNIFGQLNWTHAKSLTFGGYIVSRKLKIVL